MTEEKKTEMDSDAPGLPRTSSGRMAIRGPHDGAHPDARAIRRRTLTALAGNRTPGFHFPGYFLRLAWPRIGERDCVQTMESGSHCLDADGRVNPGAVGVMVDGALATAARLGVQAGARLATVNLTLQYTGHPATDALSMEAGLEGYYEGDAVPHGITRGVLTSAGKPVCYAAGTFLLVPPPPGVALGPLPWQSEGPPAEPLARGELSETERAVVRAANAALTRGVRSANEALAKGVRRANEALAKGVRPANEALAQGGDRAFIEHFWGFLPKAAPGGASCRVKIGAQIGNRVGHVQGGILLGLAQATASAAVPRHPAVSTISAWYISPGNGKAVSVRSKIVHEGRSFAVVKTEIRNADKSLVLEAVSNHASVKRN